MDKKSLNPQAKSILSTLIKFDRFMTTAEVAEQAEVSWNTALSHLKYFLTKGWVEKKGIKVLYWKAIYNEEDLD